MEAIGGGGFWGWNWDLSNLNDNSKKKNKKPFHKKNCKNNAATESAGGGGGGGYQFPFKQGATAGSLALTGDTIAQITQRLRKTKENSNNNDDMHLIRTILLDHDWLRALRMTSYGFLLYGPGSYAWYQYLDHCLPQQSVKNLMLKVLLNQIVLGPCVIAVVFAWNNLWLGKVSQLPAKYQKDALPTLLYGFRFWIPVSVLNFSVVPLQARVAFMSMGSIFWNFCLSSTMSK